MTTEKLEHGVRKGALFLSDEECEEFRKAPGNFNDMVRLIFASGAVAARANHDRRKSHPSPCTLCQGELQRLTLMVGEVEEEGYSCDCLEPVFNHEELHEDLYQEVMHGALHGRHGAGGPHDQECNH